MTGVAELVRAARRQRLLRPSVEWRQATAEELGDGITSNILRGTPVTIRGLLPVPPPSPPRGFLALRPVRLPAIADPQIDRAVNREAPRCAGRAA